jgi:hypothetical protein
VLLLLFNQPAGGNPSVALNASEAPDVASFSVDVLSAAPSLSLEASEGPDIASFSLVGPQPDLIAGGAGNYFTRIPSFARRWVDIKEDLEEEPTPEVVKEAARVIVRQSPDVTQAELDTLVSEHLRTFGLLSSLITLAHQEAEREYRRLEMLRQDEEEVSAAIQLFAAYLH